MTGSQRSGGKLFGPTASAVRYAYTSFDVMNRPTQIRFGRQAVNWGESIFIKGANEMARLDVAALRKAGTELKEALLPVLALHANMSLGSGMSVEGYYQFQHEPHNIDESGTYWAPINGSFSQFTNKSNATAIIGGNPPKLKLLNVRPVEPPIDAFVAVSRVASYTFCGFA